MKWSYAGSLAELANALVVRSRGVKPTHLIAPGSSPGRPRIAQFDYEPFIVEAPFLKTIIAGTREFNNVAAIQAAILDCPFLAEITQVVCGDCVGVDLIAAQWAEEVYLGPVKHFPVTPEDWATHGKPAGPRRNWQMGRYADALILIYDGESPGSSNMLEIATKLKLKIHVKILKTREGRLPWSVGR